MSDAAEAIPPHRATPYRLLPNTEQPCIMLFPNDPAAGPALDAYATELWRLYQRNEVPAYCANRDELFALVALVSALQQRAEDHRRLKATDKRTLDEMGLGNAV